MKKIFPEIVRRCPKDIRQFFKTAMFEMPKIDDCHI